MASLSLLGCCAVEEVGVRLPHPMEPLIGVVVKLPGHAAIEKRKEDLSEEWPSRHPLVVVPPAVVVRPVEATARERTLQPAEEHRVTCVHSQTDLGLTTVTSEASLADQQADQHPLFELRRHWTRTLRVVSP